MYTVYDLCLIINQFLNFWVVLEFPETEKTSWKCTLRVNYTVTCLRQLHCQIFFSSQRQKNTAFSPGLRDQYFVCTNVCTDLNQILTITLCDYLLYVFVFIVCTGASCQVNCLRFQLPNFVSDTTSQGLPAILGQNKAPRCHCYGVYKQEL